MLPEVTAGDDLEGRLLAVAERYAEPHRRYHDTRHLMAVLEHLDRILAAIDIPDREEVRLAALFHDAVYDPRSATNEADSAALAGDVLSGVIPDAAIATVRRLVLATAEHRPAALDEAALLDADLAVLAAAPEAYAAYVAGVRAEYAHVDDDAWKVGREDVLRSFLEREHIFSTPAMAAEEAAARRNLESELAQLA
jgi:predicted metal-dependent HD superfamily phosphohydrolase